MGKNISNKFCQKLLDSAKKIYNRCDRNSIKKAIPRTAEATGDLIGNKIADKITSASKKSTKELQNNERELDVERATPNKKCIYPEER